MKLDDLKQQLTEHQAQRPEIPHGLRADDPVFVEWYWRFTRWAATKARLKSKLRTHGMRFDARGRTIRGGV